MNKDLEKNDFDSTIESFCKCGTSLDRHAGMGCLYRPASPIKYEPIDVCDVVRHVPSGENWVVACVDGDRLYWVGYPYGGSAALSDCQLVTKASSEDRQKLLVKLSELTGFDVPTLRARARLTQRVPDECPRGGFHKWGDAISPDTLEICEKCGTRR